MANEVYQRTAISSSAVANGRALMRWLTQRSAGEWRKRLLLAAAVPQPAVASQWPWRR
jgi:hypothetical protein